MQTTTYDRPEITKEDSIELDNFIQEVVVPKTRDYVLEYISTTEPDDVPLFYYHVLIPLKMAEEPSVELRKSKIAELGIDGAKRYFLNQFINQIK